MRTADPLENLMAGVVTILLAVAQITCSSVPDTVRSGSTHEPLLVYLVRHGEKAVGGGDAELSTAGQERAVVLANMLGSAEIEYVHSSDYIRTRRTAAPTAAKSGLEVQLYDPQDLPALVEKLRKTGGRHLVVGHSTTTPSMVELLGGKPNAAIEEAEFDRLYIVVIGRDGAVSSVMMHYGEPYPEAGN